MTIDLTDQNFKEEALESDKLVLVDFYTSWCPPCKIIAPIIEKIADDLKDRVKVGKLNVDEARQTAFQYGIEAIPTLIIFKKGQIKERIVGLASYEVLVKKIEENL